MPPASLPGAKKASKPVEGAKSSTTPGKASTQRKASAPSSAAADGSRLPPKVEKGALAASEVKGGDASASPKNGALLAGSNGPPAPAPKAGAAGEAKKASKSSSPTPGTGKGKGKGKGGGGPKGHKLDYLTEEHLLSIADEYNKRAVEADMAAASMTDLPSKLGEKLEAMSKTKDFLEKMDKNGDGCVTCTHTRTRCCGALPIARALLAARSAGAPS